MLDSLPTDALLSAINASIRTLLATTPVIGLFTGSPTITHATLLTDLVEPTFAGYARVAVVLGTNRGDAIGDQIIPLGTASFQPTGAVSPAETITGVFLAAGAGPTLLLAGFLDTAWTASGVLDALDVVDEMYIRATPVWGGICTICTP